MRLLPKDFERLQRAILALHECRAISTFKQALPAILLGLIPADFFYLMEFERFPNSERVRIVSVIDPAQQIKPEQMGYLAEALPTHPIARHFTQTGEMAALKLSDFYSTTHRLRATEFYERFYGPIGVLRKITIPAILGPQNIGAIALCSQRKDFTERDRLILDLLRPHIDLARLNAELFSPRIDIRNRPAPLQNLTPRETEIAHWLTIGKTNPEIAIILNANRRTVEKHVEAIFRKLGVENRTAAALLISTTQAVVPPPVDAMPAGQ